MGLMSGAVAKPPVDVVLIDAVRTVQPRYVEGPSETCRIETILVAGSPRRVSVTGCSWARAVSVFEALDGWVWSVDGETEPLVRPAKTRVRVDFRAAAGWTGQGADPPGDPVTFFAEDGRTLVWSSDEMHSVGTDANLDPPALEGRCTFTVGSSGLVADEPCPAAIEDFSRIWFELARLEDVQRWTVFAGDAGR